MNDHGEQLREAFASHENLAPDPAAVYARVVDLSRTYKRRRRAAQIAGGAVLGAGLIAGGIVVPGVLHQSTPTTQATVPFAAPASAATGLGSPILTKEEADKATRAFFAAGYTYDDAVKLASLWNSTAAIGQIKAEAGQKLLAGEALPVKPDPKAAAKAKKEAATEAALNAFFNAGYTWDDAVKLAGLWHQSDPQKTKVEAGNKLLDGQKLPIKPSPPDNGGQTPQEAAEVQAFFDAGYTYEDAGTLASLWKLPSPYEAKVAAGKKLQAGETLPIKP